VASSVQLQAQAQLELRRRRRERKPPPFETYWKDRYPTYHYARHIDVLAGILEGLEPGDALILNLPPRHSKSETVGAYLEWILGRDPSDRVLYTSYSGTLAYKRSRQIRNEIRDGHAFRRHFPGVSLASDSRKVSEWALATHGHEDGGGGMIAAGVGGSVTGMGARVGVVDDPLKGRKQAESPKVREAVIDWFRSDFFTRLEPDAIIIIIQTRWHKYDLTGWLLENKDGEDFGAFNWRVLSLPAIAEDDQDPLERPAGAALWPERWPIGKLTANRNLLGEYDWASLYQQRPFLKGGSVFTDGVKRCELPISLDGALVVLTADLAASVKTSADHSVFHAGATWGRGPEMTGKVLEVRRGRWSVDQQINHMQQMQALYGQPFYVERSPNAIPVIDVARSRGVRIIEVKPEGDKFSRAQPYASAWNGGRVEVPMAPWATVYISELTSFKGDGSDDADDQVDTGSYWWRIAQRAGASWSVRGEAAG